MRFWLGLGLIVAFVSGASAQQTPGPVGDPEGVWREQIHWIPMRDAAGADHLLYARVCRPAGEAPARVVEVAHGVAPEVNARLMLRPLSCDSEAARWFLERGYVVIAALRRGFGATRGAFAEIPGPCDNRRDYAGAGREAARDIAATLDYAATLTFARAQGMVVVGQSAGGWATIAYNSTPHPRATALVNMAGGLGGHHQQQPNNNCLPNLLAEAAGRLARGATTPMLWVYTENDSFFAPSIAASLYAAYSQNGGRAEFYQLGPFRDDGHRLFFGTTGSQIWGPLVARYLASQPAQ